MIYSEVEAPKYFMVSDGKSYYYQIFKSGGRVDGVNLYDGETGDFIKDFNTVKQMERFTGWKGEAE